MIPPHSVGSAILNQWYPGLLWHRNDNRGSRDHWDTTGCLFGGREHLFLDISLGMCVWICTWQQWLPQLCTHIEQVQLGGGPYWAAWLRRGIGYQGRGCCCLRPLLAPIPPLPIPPLPCLPLPRRGFLANRSGTAPSRPNHRADDHLQHSLLSRCCKCACPAGSKRLRIASYSQVPLSKLAPRTGNLLPFSFQHSFPLSFLSGTKTVVPALCGALFYESLSPGKAVLAILPSFPPWTATV